MSSPGSRILVVDPVDEQVLQQLRREHDVHVHLAPSPGELAALLAAVDVLILRSGVRLDAEALAAAPHLRVVARAGSGTDNIDVAELARRSIVLLTVPSQSADSVAELALALLLGLARHVPLADRELRAGRWRKAELVGVELRGKILGVVGLGRIGHRVAELGAALGMTVLGTVDRDGPARRNQLAAEGIELTALDALLSGSDAVVLAVPLTPSTQSLLGEREFGLMRPSALLVNVSRGGVVDEPALERALETGELRGAALDVFSAERGTPRLATNPRTVMTPHLGAMTQEAQARVGKELLHRLRSALPGTGATSPGSPTQMGKDASATPEVMTATMLVQPFQLRKLKRPVPAPGPGQLLVEVLATGICGSDLASYRGSHPYKVAPAVLGHELCGRVRRIGEGVRSFAVGDLVCSAAFSPCDECASCHEGQVNLCVNRQNLSHLGWDGSFAEFVVLAQNMTFVLPPSVAPEVGALMEPLAIAHHALNRPSALPTDLVVLGSGGIGASCALVAHRLGVREIICVDRGSAAGERMKRLGTTGYVDASQTVDVPAEVVRLLGRRAGTTVVASGHRGVMDQAAAITRPGGEVVVVSYFDSPVPVALNAFVGQEMSLLPSNLCTPEDFTAVISWGLSAAAEIEALITHRYPLAEAGAAMALMERALPDTGKIMLLSSAVLGA